MCQMIIRPLKAGQDVAGRFACILSPDGAEDSLPLVRQRLEGIALAAEVSFESLPIEVITEIAALLSYLRELQRQFQLAVLLVHHARKDSHSSRLYLAWFH